MKKIKDYIKKISQSRNIFKFILIMGIIIISTLIFTAGMLVGFHKASFGKSWGEHYNENFGMGYEYTNKIKRSGMKMPYFPNAHGATGKIIKIEANNLIIQDRDNIEKIISIDKNTKIQEAREIKNLNDIHIDDFVVVIGTPNDKGMINAKFIRVISNPEIIK